MKRLGTLALAQWLADPDVGINAFLPTVVVAPEDEGVGIDPIAAFFNPFEHDAACDLNKEPGRYPACYVTPDGPVEFDGEVNQNELDAGAMSFRIWIVFEQGLSPRGHRLASYYLTALNRALSAFCAETPAARAARQREYCQLITCTARIYDFTQDDVGGVQRLGVVMLTSFTVRNTEAS